jgi:hypothetical protein
VDGKPKFDQPKSEVVAESMFHYAELQKQGMFKPNRDIDLLSAAIGSKELGGYVRGVSSKLTV